MKKLLVGFGMFMLVLGLGEGANATLITWSSTSYTSPYAGVTTETFDSGSIPISWSVSGSGGIVNSSVSSEYAAPYNVAASEADATKYLTVPIGSTSINSYTITFDDTYNYMGLWWGSIDTYNSITFSNSTTGTSVIYTGTDILNMVLSAAGSPTDVSAITGDQDSEYTNLYVNFIDLGTFDTVTLTSTSKAFELDNLAVGNVPVPEPATMLTLGLGMLGLAGLKRRFRR